MNRKQIKKIMKTKQIVIAVLTLGVSALSMVAQPTERPQRPEGGPGQGHRPPPPLFASLDANRDGTISADEIANAPTSLKTLDKNSDGQLTPEEIRLGKPPGKKDGEAEGNGEGAPKQRPPAGQFEGKGGGHPPVPSIDAALDANKDGTIGADEIANSSTSLKTLDKNSDGQLTVEELRPERRREPRGDK